MRAPSGNTLKPWPYAEYVISQTTQWSTNSPAKLKSVRKGSYPHSQGAWATEGREENKGPSIVLIYRIPSWVKLSVAGFSLLAAQIAPQDIMKSSQQEGDFQDRASLVFPNPVTKVCSVFSNRVV